MLEELQHRDYSHSTARIYVHVVSDFARLSAITGYARAGTHPEASASFVPEEVVSLHDQATYGALRFFFFKTLHRNFRAEYIPFPKFRKRLPTILSPEEGGRLIDSASNLFHRTLIMTLYSTKLPTSQDG
jgi:integrase